MKEWFSRNIGMKIISLIIAILIWVMINGMIDPITTTTIKDIPVHLINEEAMTSVNKIFEIISGETISVKLRAKKTIAESLTADDFTAVADIINKTELNAIEIVVTCNSHPETDIEIIEKKTSDGTGMMKLSLEDSDTQSFAVSVVADGTVKDGFYVTESTVSPNLITISGSKTQIAKIAKIAVLVNVEGVSESFHQQSTPVVYDKNGNVVDSVKLTMSTEQVQVALTLLPTKQINLNVNQKGNAYYDYTCTGIEYAPHTITIAGKAEDLSKIHQLDLTCDITNAYNDVERELSIEEALQERYGDTYIIVDESENVSVKATIVKMQTKDITILTAAIELRNLPENMQAEFANLTTNIKLVGIPEDLNQYSSSNLKAYIDCSTYTAEGTYRALIQTEGLSKVESRLSSTEISIIQKPDTALTDDNL